MDRAPAKAILEQFNAAHALLRGNVELHVLPAALRSEIDRISQMRSFREELSKFLAAYGLPPLTPHRSDGWTHFLHLYGKVIEDIPLLVSVPAAKHKSKQAPPDSGPKYISHVIVHCESAQQTIKHANGEEVLFKMTWTIHDNNGQSGEIFTINSFSSQSD